MPGGAHALPGHAVVVLKGRTGGGDVVAGVRGGAQGSSGDEAIATTAVIVSRAAGGNPNALVRNGTPA